MHFSYPLFHLNPEKILSDYDHLYIPLIMDLITFILVTSFSIEIIILCSLLFLMSLCLSYYLPMISYLNESFYQGFIKLFTHGLFLSYYTREENYSSSHNIIRNPFIFYCVKYCILNSILFDEYYLFILHFHLISFHVTIFLISLDISIFVFLRHFNRLNHSPLNPDLTKIMNDLIQYSYFELFQTDSSLKEKFILIAVGFFFHNLLSISLLSFVELHGIITNLHHNIYYPNLVLQVEEFNQPGSILIFVIFSNVEFLSKKSLVFFLFDKILISLVIRLFEKVFFD